MKGFVSIFVVAVLFVLGAVSKPEAQEKDALRLVQSIPMPDVNGRIDHTNVDVKGKRLFLAGLSSPQATPPEAEPIRLVQTIPMPGVQGRMDHLGIDIKGKRLFAAALGDNQNTVEVIDLKAGKRIFSIAGQSKPQGVFYSPRLRKIVCRQREGKHLQGLSWR